MTINERVRYFRKNIKHLSQTEFAKKLGMKQTSVSSFEKNGATITEQTLKSICTIFQIREEWLRYGTEPMDIQPEIFSLDDFAKKRGATDLELDIIKAYFNLDQNIRKEIISAFTNIFISSNNDPYSDVPYDPEEFDKRFFMLNKIC